MQIESGGSVYTETSQIITIFEDHYQKGYEEKADQFISLMPHLQENDRVSVDEPITREEIKLAVEALQKKPNAWP